MNGPETFFQKREVEATEVDPSDVQTPVVQKSERSQWGFNEAQRHKRGLSGDNPRTDDQSGALQWPFMLRAEAGKDG